MAAETAGVGVLRGGAEPQPGAQLQAASSERQAAHQPSGDCWRVFQRLDEGRHGALAGRGGGAVREMMALCA